MAYCRKCGKLLPDNANHCTVCGSPVSRQPGKYDTGRIPPVSYPGAQHQQASRNPGQPNSYGDSVRLGSPRPAQPVSRAEPKKKKSGTLIGLYILLAVLILALVGVGVWYLLGSNGGKKSDPNLGRYDVVSCETESVEVPTDGEYVILKAKGKAVIRLTEVLDATWELEDSDLTLTLEDAEYTGTLEDGVLTLEAEGKHYTFEKGASGDDAPGYTDNPTETTAPRTQDRTWWEGDWYGWWTVLEGSGEMYMMERAAWDVCAKIEMNEDGTCKLHIWDEHPEQNQFIWYVDGRFEEGSDQRGVLVSEGITFLGTSDNGQLRADPAAMPYAAFGDLLCISGTYVDPENPENSCTYSIILRPWGAQWEDIRTGDMTGMPYPDMMPIRYDSWYLPLIREGAGMPAAFKFD